MFSNLEKQVLFLDYPHLIIINYSCRGQDFQEGGGYGAFGLDDLEARMEQNSQDNRVMVEEAAVGLGTVVAGSGLPQGSAPQGDDHEYFYIHEDVDNQA